MILDETMHCCESDMECCWKFWSISLNYIKFSEVGINVKVAIKILFIFKIKQFYQRDISVCKKLLSFLFQFIKLNWNKKIISFRI